MVRSLQTSAFAIVFALSLSACVTTGGLESGPGSALALRLASDPHTARLDRRSIRKAVSAEIKALETAPPGTSVTWKSGESASGEIRPGQAYEISGRACRRFDHAITVGEDTRILSSTACQREKGDWEPLS